MQGKAHPDGSHGIDPPTFHEGDEVVLAEGTYQGTLGDARLRTVGRSLSSCPSGISNCTAKLFKAALSIKQFGTPSSVIVEEKGCTPILMRPTSFVWSK